MGLTSGEVLTETQTQSDKLWSIFLLKTLKNVAHSRFKCGCYTDVYTPLFPETQPMASTGDEHDHTHHR